MLFPSFAALSTFAKYSGIFACVSKLSIVLKEAATSGPITGRSVAEPPQRIAHVKENVIISNRVMFRTIPGGGLVVRDHSRETNRDKYYVIGEEQFEEKARQSLMRQAMEAGFPKRLAEEIKFHPVSGKKVVSRLYGIMIDVSAITFIVEADSMILQYFYQAGASSRTAIGYGLCSIIEQL